MGRNLLYNYKTQVIPQRPDRNGGFRYGSYHKYDIVIKNVSDEAIYNLLIKIIFARKSEIIKIILTDPSIGSAINDNVANITMNCLNKDQKQNFDVCVAGSEITDSIQLLVESPEAIAINRYKKLPIKKGSYRIERNQVKLTWIRNIINNQWTIKIAGSVIGGIILYFILNQIKAESDQADPTSNQAQTDHIKTIISDSDSLKALNNINGTSGIPDSTKKSSTHL